MPVAPEPGASQAGAAIHDFVTFPVFAALLLSCLLGCGRPALYQLEEPATSR